MLFLLCSVTESHFEVSFVEREMILYRIEPSSAAFAGGFVGNAEEPWIVGMNNDDDENNRSKKIKAIA